MQQKLMCIGKKKVIIELQKIALNYKKQLNKIFYFTWCLEEYRKQRINDIFDKAQVCIFHVKS